MIFLFHHPSPNSQQAKKTVVVGRIKEMLIPEGNTKPGWTGVITLEQFILGSSCHLDLDCPVLRKPRMGRPAEDTACEYLIVEPEVSQRPRPSFLLKS